MPYHRPIYQQYPCLQQQQQQQQQQQHESYQQTLPHAPNVFALSQARRQDFTQNRGMQSAPAVYNRGCQGRQTMPMGPTQQPRSHLEPMMMDSHRYNHALDQEASEDASQKFPNEIYYCDDEPYRSQAIYQTNNQDIAAERGRLYGATRDRLVDSEIGAMRPQYTQRLSSAYEQQMEQLDVTSPSVQYHHQQQQQHHHHQMQHIQGGLHPRPATFRRAAELAQHTGRHQQPQQLLYDQPPIYADQVASSGYSGDFPLVANETYVHYSTEPMPSQTSAQHLDNFQAQYAPDSGGGGGGGDSIDPVGPRRGGQYLSNGANVELMCQQADGQDPQHYATVHHQPEQLVRQELGVNPRKISRVSASAITCPSARQQLHYHRQPPPRHPADSLDCDQYSSDTDTYRVVSSPEDNDRDEKLGGHQSYHAQAPFVERVNSDQTEEYSSFENSLAASAPGGNRSPQDHAHLRLEAVCQQQREQQIQNQSLLSQPRQQRPNLENYIDMRSSGTVSQDWLDMICRQMIEHMNDFGICVIDNFLGSLKGEAILDEVLQLYSNRNYTTGRLVSDRRDESSDGSTGGSEPTPKLAAVDPAKLIRNDRVIWVDGCEDGCSEINNLIQTLCSVITNSSRLSLYSGNALDKIVINKRTKAHVACYPGNRTRYIKHVDNPNNDGRVITAIYYLNKDWNTKRDGGLLRMFPAGMDTVANIEPLFDRVLFFWSDRRNPHEVLPAFRDRFAITVWYIASETGRVQ